MDNVYKACQELLYFVYVLLYFKVLSVSYAGGIKCVKNFALHSASILSISAGENWLGIGAADNSMSLFHRPQERLSGFASPGSKMAGWQLYRTPQKTVAMVCYKGCRRRLLCFPIYFIV